MPVDADRLAELVDAHAAALALYAAKWTLAPEDCVQEAFVELARQPSDPENVAAWLFRVVRNRAINAARGEQRRREREQAVARLRPVVAVESFGDALDATTITESLDELDPGLYEVTVLRIWSGRSFEEIAAILDCSVSTAHRRYRRALEQLREILEPMSCPTKSNFPKS